MELLHRFSPNLHTICKEIVATEPFKIEIVTFQSTVERQVDEWRWVGWFRPFWP